MRRLVLPLLLAGGLVTGLPACESTQSTSARLAQNTSASLKAEGLNITTANRAVKVVARTVLRDDNGVAAVLLLSNAGAAQAKVPLLIDVRDAKDRRLYTNATPGLDPSLTSVPLIERGARTFWVNNQIQAAATPRRVRAKVGAAERAPRRPPRIQVSKLKLLNDTSGAFARGVIANHSEIPQRRLVVSCISRRGGAVVAAGRAIVDRLAPAPTPKPVTFRVYFIGDPARGTLRCVAPPTVLERSPS